MSSKPPLTVVKIGGNVIDDPVALDSFLKDFAAIRGAKILVHGGGKMATRTAESLGITAVFHEGRRITDAPMLEVAVMTYAGWINKNITAKLQALGDNAMGFTGADGNLIQAKKRENAAVDFGLVGDVVSVNTELLKTLLKQDVVPVFCAVTHDGNGQLLNTNADTIASPLAVACTGHYEVKLLYCFEKKGVLLDVNDEDSVIKTLTFESYNTLREQGAIHSGMLPKLENCFNALNQDVVQIGIGSPAMIKGESYTIITK
ncbi:acetylglutamate kinase [Flavobacterium hauense]